MPACEKYLDIEASPQRIWDFISDFSNWGKALEIGSPLRPSFPLTCTFRLAEGSVPGENAVVVMSQDPDKYGLTRRGSRERPLAWRILEWVPLRSIALGTQRSGWILNYTAAMAFTIEPKGQLSTRVGFASDVETPGRLLQLLYSESRVQRNAEEQARNVLARLREAVLP
ncbi:MAG: SRPBCC family protein [Elusimicrobia bacterium]|nr:SRPBCC family protein [Elusimicrobiota bacterium]